MFVHSPCGSSNSAFIRKIGGQTQRATPWMMTDRRFFARGAAAEVEGPVRFPDLAQT
jgi:hypothetical protein